MHGLLATVAVFLCIVSGVMSEFRCVPYCERRPDGSMFCGVRCSWTFKKRSATQARVLPCNFDTCDKDKDGVILLGEFETLGNADEGHHMLFKTAFHLMDVDDDGKVTEEEFINGPLYSENCNTGITY